jgi:hypothetical protein
VIGTVARLEFVDSPVRIASVPEHPREDAVRPVDHSLDRRHRLRRPRVAADPPDRHAGEDREQHHGDHVVLRERLRDRLRHPALDVLDRRQRGARRGLLRLLEVQRAGERADVAVPGIPRLEQVHQRQPDRERDRRRWLR